MCLIYQCKITEIGFLRFCRIGKAYFKSMVCGGLLQSRLYNRKARTTDRLNLTRDCRLHSLRCFIKRLVNIVITRPNIIGKFRISKRHFCSIFVCHSKACQHGCIYRGIFHKLLNVYTHFLIEPLDPCVSFLRSLSKTSTETSRYTIPFNSLVHKFSKFLNKTPYGIYSSPCHINET